MSGYKWFLLFLQKENVEVQQNWLKKKKKRQKEPDLWEPAGQPTSFRCLSFRDFRVKKIILWGFLGLDMLFEDLDTYLFLNKGVVLLLLYHILCF